MKLTGLNEALLSFNGKAILLPEGEMTARLGLLQFIGTMRPTPGMQSASVLSLATRLYECEDGEMEVESLEFPLLEAAVRQNGPGYPCIVCALLEDYLDGIKQAAKGKSVAREVDSR